MLSDQELLTRSLVLSERDLPVVDLKDKSIKQKLKFKLGLIRINSIE